jgi:integrase
MALKFTKITRENCRALSPGKRLDEHNIRYTKLANGDGRFEIFIQVNGKRDHRSVGKESEGVTRKQAEILIEKYKTEGREDRLKLTKGRKLPMAFKEVAEKYLKRLEETDGRNLKIKTQQLKSQLIPFFAKTPLVNLSSFEVERFKRHCKDEGLSPSTINRYLAVLSHVISMAMNWDWLDRKPCQIVRCVEPLSKRESLSKEEVRHLLETAKAYPHPFIWLFMVIGLQTGMRKMEILSIRIENLDLNRRILFIPSAKGGAREQPLSAHLVEVLNEHLKGCPSSQVWLFPSKASELGHMVAIEKTYQKVVLLAGLDPAKVVRHTMRHTVISHLIEARVDVTTIKKISGHKTTAMVERYAHVSNRHVQEAQDLLSVSYGG